MSNKRQDIIDAGAGVFLKEGFSAASVNEIARKAGVSKRTLYKYFDSKTALFGAIIGYMCEHMMGTLDPAAIAHETPRATLSAFARTYLDLVLSPPGLDLNRIVIAEAKRFPELGLTFHAAGYERTVQALADYLAKQDAQGTLRVPDPETQADQFLGLCLGSLRLRAYYDPTLAEERALIERWIDTAVSLFLRGCGYAGAERTPGLAREAT